MNTKYVLIVFLLVIMLLGAVFLILKKIKKNKYNKRRLEFFTREVNSEYVRLKYFLDNKKNKYDFLSRKQKVWYNELIDILIQIESIKKSLNVNNLFDCEEKMKSGLVKKIGELITLMDSKPDEKLNISAFTDVRPNEIGKPNVDCTSLKDNKLTALSAKSTVSDSVFFENPEFFAKHKNNNSAVEKISEDFDFSNSPEVSHWQ